jgi:hypothetical protein
MVACPKCGVNRRYVGVAFPVRRLCKCESRTCGSCATAAVFVEFQNPIKTEEPKLPAKSNHLARFSCKDHAPDDLPQEPMDDVSDRQGRPHIDPMYGSSRPPSGSDSKEKVVCYACGLVHEARQRVMWNGTYSECPVETCKNHMFVHHWEDS